MVQDDGRPTVQQSGATGGILTLTAAIGYHWLAVQRDLIALGYENPEDDIFTDVLPLAKLLAIIVPSPPGTAVRWSLDKGWTLTDHLLANLGEQGAGLIELQGRHPRPGVSDVGEVMGQMATGQMAHPGLGGANRAVDIDAMRKSGRVVEKVTGFDSMPLEQWERIKAENWAREPGPMRRAR